MGFHISWVAVRGVTPNVVRSRLRLRQTNEREYVPESDVTGVELPTGWYLVFFNDPLPPELDDEKLASLSIDAEMFVFVVEESSMVSLAKGYLRGEKQWEVVHDSNQGLEHVEVSGTPPSSYQAIRDRLLEELKTDDNPCDYLFDIPADMSMSLVSFRHDQDIEGIEGDAFEVLART